MVAAGCLSLSTPVGSSGIWTGESRPLSASLVSRKASERVGFSVGSSLALVLGCSDSLLASPGPRGNVERALGISRGGGFLDRSVANVAR